MRLGLLITAGDRRTGADPASIRKLSSFIGREGTTRSADDASNVRALTHAGATWWIESDWAGATIKSLRRRIADGPPRI